MNKLFSFKKRSNVCYTTSEPVNNKLIELLIDLKSFQNKPKPKNIDTANLNHLDKNIILICHAESIIEGGKKSKFLSEKLNSYEWWSKNMLNNFNVIYLCACDGFSAFRWKIKNFSNKDERNKVISYNSTLTFFWKYNIPKIVDVYYDNIRKKTHKTKDRDEYIRANSYFFNKFSQQITD